MSHRKAFVVAPMGEALDAARVVNWLIEPGQNFAAGDIVLELETDKSVVEIPAVESGRLLEHLVAKGGLLPADARVAWIEVEGPEAIGSPHAEPGMQPVELPVDATRGLVPVVAASMPLPAPAADAGERVAATPVARRLAAQLGIDLRSLSGSGPNARIVRADVAATAAASQPPIAGDAPVWQSGMQRLRIPVATGMLHGIANLAPAQGSAPTVLLLHGLFGDLDTWAGTISSARRAGLAVAALDLPAHGRSQASAARFGEVVSALAEALPAFGDAPVALVAHSLGAAFAARLGVRLARRLHSLTLFAPVGLGTHIDQAFIDGMLHAASDEALARELGKLTAQRSVPSPDYRNALRERLETHRRQLTQLCRSVSVHGVQQVDVLPDLRALTCPMSIVHGREDDIVPWQHALNAPPRAALHLVGGVGHMPQAEAMVLAWDVIQRTLRP